MGAVRAAADTASANAFRSLAEVQERHAALVKEVGNDILASGNPERIADFVRKALASGRVLDAKEDRAAAQGLVNFWTSRLASASREADRSDAKRTSFQASQAVVSLAPLSASELPTFDDTLLAEFDLTTLRTATEAADRWIETLGEDDRSVVRRVLLRLARLSTEGETFEPVPSTRAALYDLDSSPEKVEEVIARLAEAGVVRVTKGSTAETDQISLRDGSLLTTWGTYRTWLDGRLSFRAHVVSWDQGDRPTEKLFEHKELDEARFYGDRNAVEREFTDQSRRQEIWQGEKNRWLKYIFGAFAAVALTGLVCTAFSAYNWYVSARLAGQRGDAMAEKLRLTETTSLVRSITAYVVAAGISDSDADREIAFRRLDAIQKFTKNRPEIQSFFEKYGPTLQRIHSGRGSEDDINQVRRAALDLARRYKADILDVSSPDDDVAKSLSDERKVIFDSAEFCAERIVKIASEGKPYHDADPYLKEFWVLYWGEMGLVENEEVESAMVQFGRCLKAIDTRIATTIRSNKAAEEYLGKPDTLKRLTNRQAIQLYYAQAKTVAKSKLNREDVDSAKVDPQKELPKLQQALDVLKKTLAAELAQPLSVKKPLTAS